MALFVRNDSSKWERLCFAALHEQEKMVGQNHADTLDSVYWLGHALYDQDQLKNAEAMLHRALEGREKGWALIMKRRLTLHTVSVSLSTARIGARRQRLCFAEF